MTVSTLTVSGLKQLPDKDGNIKLKAIVRFTNYGKGPAILKSYAVIGNSGKELPAEPTYGAPIGVRYIIAPNHWFGSVDPDEIIATKDIIPPIIDGTTHLWVVVRLDYADAFRRPHVTSGAYRIIFGEAGNSVRFLPDGPDSYWEYT